MLKRLHINNFVLIDRMDVEFPGGLTVITGETGAGKSIFLEALGLVLGKRAEGNLLLNPAKKCVIEAEFDVSKLELDSFFEEENILPENTLLLRREISPDGRSRTFLNDGVVGLSTLKKVSEKLIDIHSQHQTLLLNKEGFQLSMLDTFAGTDSLFKEYHKEYQQLQTLRRTLNELNDEQSKALREKDYFQFLYDELSAARVKPGDLERLEEEFSSFQNHDTIRSGLLQAAGILKTGENNLLEPLQKLRQSLISLGRFGQQYKDFSDRVSSAYIDLKDLGTELEALGESLQLDQGRYAEVSDRIDLLNRLMSKHQVRTEVELMKIEADLEQKLGNFSSLESRISETGAEISKKEKQCEKQASQLSKKRRDAVNGLQAVVDKLLGELSLSHAQFNVDIQQKDALGATGWDEVTFLFSANRGTRLQPLNAVASGGEMSRLMLSLKSVMAEKRNLPVIIFDEIDTGVSGEVADQIGKIIKRMGETMQVVVITHLPQMASKGAHHLFVYKHQDEAQTLSHIRQLNKEERVLEIAKMLSNANPTQTALKNARELLAMN